MQATTSPVFVTYDCEDGRQHIALDTEYMGSVNGYTTGITRAFARLFGKAITVKIAGEERCFNKKSYLKLLISIGKADATLKNLSQYADFNQAAQGGKTLGIKMRDGISPRASAALGYRLHRAIRDSKCDEAVLLINKGAQVDTEYCERGRPRYALHYGNPLGDVLEGLNENREHDFDAFWGKPIHHAALRQLPKVTARLKAVGAPIGLAFAIHVSNKIIRTQVTNTVTYSQQDFARITMASQFSQMNPNLEVSLYATPMNRDTITTHTWEIKPSNLRLYCINDNLDLAKLPDDLVKSLGAPAA